MLLLWLALQSEIVRLSPETWDRVPGGKEVDAIYGDWLLRNDKVVAVIADAKPDRHANMSIKHVQGAVIDFALRSTSNDQLSAFLPHRDGNANVVQAHRIEVVKASGPAVVLRAVREATEKDPVEAITDYELRDGEDFLRVTTRFRNTSDEPVKRRLSDKMRCDQTFTQTPAGWGHSVTFHDRWFGAAYGVVRPSPGLETDGKFGGLFGPNAGTWVDYPDLRDDGKLATLEPGKERSLTRYLIVGRDGTHLDVRILTEVLRHAGGPHGRVKVLDEAGRPLEGADVVERRGEAEGAWGRTGPDGLAWLSKVPVTVSAPGRTAVELKETGGAQTVKLGPASAVDFEVDGPCKVQFVGVDGTLSPNFGPKQRAQCLNLWHSPVGRFKVPVPPGKYYVTISRGPEHDAAWRYVVVREGETAKLAARLARVVDTRGWVSADFHNHATESGDNTTETESRLICLAAEGVEFAPATEHNRIVSWKARIRALGLPMSSSDGIELTSSPLPLSHHNAFPLVEKPRTQDGGGPTPDAHPLTQLRRLLDHDSGAEKLLQQNHPDIGWLFYDVDGDGERDLGFGTAKLTDVIEIWRPTILGMKPTENTGLTPRNNRAFNWLQLLNQGFRLPGVANTDAHYCAHESGRIRNWVRSSTDDPLKIDELEMVRNSKKGRLVMSNGPFLEVALNGAGPGEELRLDGPATLKVRVQCANWLDVDRLQVLINGRPGPSFTRAATPEPFRDGVVKFEAEIPLTFKEDAHVIVVAIGERSTIGPVMGQNTETPCAISNPVWVDVDGGGVKANGDTLGAPLPAKK